jgi:zinc and cadmium transporter
MSATAQVALYSLLVVIASLSGGLVMLLARLTHTRTQLLMSFVAGMMLGVGLFHMLPHSVVETGSLDRSIIWMMGGLLLMFFLQRFFHFHQHGPSEMGLEVEGASVAAHRQHDHDHHHEHGHDHDHDAGRNHGHADSSQGHALNWIGIAIGLTIHTLLDGIALAASVEVEAAVPAASGLFGLGTFLAVLLHKPLDAMAITTLMLASGWSAWSRHLVNLLFALVAPLGVGLFYLGVQRLGDQHNAVGCALAFSAGTFLCISLSDLLPEVQFHAHDRVKLSIALLLGIAASYVIGFFEAAGHDHLHNGHSHEHRSHEHGHGHRGHEGHDHR